jgi:SAM-dependent methyltransferase
VGKSYEDQLLEQIEQYRDTEEMHDLPPVFHIWSSEYIGPRLRQVFGVGDINSFYVEAFMAAASHHPGAPTFLSLGCGDGAVEIEIAKTLVERGIKQFLFVCYDLSDILLARFRSAMPTELADRFDLQVGDLNALATSTRFDAIMANHSLHHMVDLGGIFRTSFASLAENGVFVTNDIIGRNGHMRWPETKMFIDFFWPLLSQRQRHNVLLRRTEKHFMDHDCSTEGFEGIRAQDVLPAILTEGFHPWKFLGFGGMIDVFVDRCFGPNFDLKDPDDVFLARQLGFFNEILLDAGLVKPTMMLAYFTKRPVSEIYFRNRSARMAVREAGSDPAWLAGALEDFARSQTDPDFVFRSGASVRFDGISFDAPGSGNGASPFGALAEMLAALRHAQKDAAGAQGLAETKARQLEAMENSTSWRITAPLRKLARIISQGHVHAP